MTYLVPCVPYLLVHKCDYHIQVLQINEVQSKSIDWKKHPEKMVVCNIHLSSLSAKYSKEYRGINRNKSQRMKCMRSHQ